MRKLALLLSLLALGALGLTACGGGDDDEANAASRTETTVSVSRFGSKACGSAVFPGQAGGHGRFEVVEGYFSCRVARGVLSDYFRDGYIGGRDTTWSCRGPEGIVVCTKTIKARFPQGRRG